ncbi:MAG: hypothetical protein U0325_08595 [Polyangiales bacterium]
MRSALRRAAPLLLGLAASSCGNNLDPAWKVNAFRILAAPIDNLDRVETPSFTDIAPGERVRLRLITADNVEPARAVQIIWVFCAQATVTGNTFGCAPGGASVQMGAEVVYQLPVGALTSIDTLGRSRVQAVAVACTGTLGFDPATNTPTCSGNNAVSWTMTRSIQVRPPTPTEPSNRNPQITEVVLYRGTGTEDPVVLDASMPLRLPRCAAEPCRAYTVEIRAPGAARETYTSLNAQAQPVPTRERLVFGYFTTLGEYDGSFRIDTDRVPEGPIRNTIEAPKTAGTARLWFTAQDNRGGVDVVARSVIFE